MQTIFIMVKCELGKAYDVADGAVQDIEQVSEVYSTSGQYDLLMKCYLTDEQDVAAVDGYAQMQVDTLLNLASPQPMYRDMIDQGGMPCAACAAEMPSRPISLAVSNPSPNRKPSGYICQLARIMPASGRSSRASNPRPASSRSRSSST